MTIEQKALELVNAVREERDLPPHSIHYIQRADAPDDEALCRALEARELDKSRHAAELREQAERFEAFRQEVSKVAEWAVKAGYDTIYMRNLILAPVDPLVEAVAAVFPGDQEDVRENMAESIRAALEARGLAIVKKEAVNG